MDGRDPNGRVSVGGRDARIHVNRASPRLVSLPHHIDRPHKRFPTLPFLAGSSRGMSTRDKLFAFLVLGVMSAAAVGFVQLGVHLPVEYWTLVWLAACCIIGLVIAVTCAARSGAVSLTAEVYSHS